MRKTSVIVFVVLLGIFLVQFASAEILFSSMKDKYSLGDTLTATVTVSPTVTNEDYLQFYLNCGENSSSDFYKQFLIIPMGEKKDISVDLLLTPRVVGSSIGECSVNAVYGVDSVTSGKFRITNGLTVSLNLDKKSFAPSEEFVLSGNVKRETLDLSDGFVEVTDGKYVNVKGVVEKGVFSLNVQFPEDTPAGAYNLVANSYEKDSRGFITNTGNASTGLIIVQVPRRVGIVLSNQEIMPGDIIEFKGDIYDQTDLNMAGEITYTIKDKNDYVREQNITDVNSTKKFQTSKTEAPGIWTILISHENLTTSKILNILENSELEMSLVNDTLVLANVGNVPYNKSVSFKIGNNTVDRFVFLDLGQSKKVYLSAPDGNYDVFVDDGKSSVSGKGISLTGDAIDVSEIKKGLLFQSENFIYVWGFILTILVLVAIIIYIRVRRNPFRVRRDFGSGGGGVMKQSDEEFKSSGMISRPKQFHEDIRAVTGEMVDTAVPTYVNDGAKQEVGLVALAVKNYDSLLRRKSGAINEIKRISDSVLGNSKIVNYSTDNYVIYLAAPTLTKTLKNAVSAVKVATRLERELNEYNKMHQDKIDFGISVHSGDIIAKKDGRKLKFTAMGNTVVLAKKIAHMANNGVYLSEKVHKMTMPEVRSKEADTGSYTGLRVYEVENVVDRDKNTKFLNDFKERNFSR